MDGADGCDGGETVPDDGVASDFEERFWDVEGKRTETGAATGTADLERVLVGVFREGGGIVGGRCLRGRGRDVRE